MTAYQTFLFVADSIKLDRACSSDVYSVLRSYKNESWDNFYDGLCYSHEPLIVMLVHAPNSAMWLLGHSMSNHHKKILTPTDLNENWFLHSVS